MASSLPPAETIDSFALAPADQKTSKLLQLPAEVRTMILRELLVSNEPLPARRLESEGKDEHGAQTETSKLHIAVLCACQMLCKEGYPVLYNENVLTIISRAPQPKKAEFFTDPVQKFWIARFGECSFTSGSAKNAIIVAFIARFGKFVLFVLPELGLSFFDFPDDFLFRWLRELQAVIQGKEVIVNVEHPSRKCWKHDSVSKDDECFVAARSRVVAAFRLWRCKNISFSGVDGEVWRETANIVKSEAPVVDVPSLVDDATRLLDPVLWPTRGLEHTSAETNKIRKKLENAKKQFDLGTYEQVRPEVIRVAERAFMKKKERLYRKTPEIEKFHAVMKKRSADEAFGE